MMLTINYNGNACQGLYISRLEVSYTVKVTVLLTNNVGPCHSICREMDITPFRVSSSKIDIGRLITATCACRIIPMGQ